MNILKKLVPYLSCLALLIVATLGGELLKKTIEPTNLVLFYVLIVVVASIRWGEGPAIFTSVLSVLAFDFFIIPPYLTFRVSDIQYIFTFVVLLIVGLVVSTLASRTRAYFLQQDKEKLQTALLNSISHDLKTPLAVIKGSLAALLNDNGSLSANTRRKFLKTAFFKTAELNDFIGRLLDMTKMEAGALVPDRQLCELRDILGVSLRQFSETKRSKDIRIHIPRKFPELAVDFILMTKVFTNLIDNALKYSKAGSLIEIRAKNAGGKIVIEIKDHGQNLPKKELTKIFDKFYRVSGPQRQRGDGLGLSICQGIVTGHGGKIKARNNSGPGLTFTITLPEK